MGPFIKITAFIGLISFCAILSISALRLMLPALFGISDPDLFLQNVGQQTNTGAIVFYLAVNSIGVFLLPPLIFFFLFRVNIIGFMRLNRLPPPKFWLLAIACMAFAVIFIQLLVQVMLKIPLPEQYESLRRQDDLIGRLIDHIFSKPTAGNLLFVTLTVALLPAVAEEVFFRGLIQNYLSRTNLHETGAVVVTGLSFSLMHMEFDNFLAIWCLGIVLGFIYYYSSSLWVSITVHFLNNFIIIGTKFLYHLHTIKADASEASDALPVSITLPAGAAMIAALVMLERWSRPPGVPENAA